MKPKMLSLVLLSFLFGSAYAQQARKVGRLITAVEKKSFPNALTNGPLGPADCDTIDYPAPAGWSEIYYSSGTAGTEGFVTGNNVYGDKQKANRYDLSATANTYIHGAYVDFLKAGTKIPANLSKLITFNVYDEVSNKPGSVLGSVQIPFSQIKADKDANVMTRVMFAAPIALPASKKFYLSADVSALQFDNDSITIASTIDGEALPAKAWEQWSDNSWHTVFYAWGINLTMWMFPFVSTNSSSCAQIICPVPTNLSASNISNTAAKVSWAGTAVTYKLQYKIAGTNTWTSVNNIANNYYILSGLSQNTKYNYRVQAICTGSEKSEFSTTASFTTTNNYCGTGGSTQYGYINNVKLGSINNTSGNNNGYADYTGLSTSIGTGSSQTIGFTPGGGSHYYWEVYIDYNHDADFLDAGEKAGQGDAYGAVDVSFTVPETALTGNTRMRIIMQYAIGYLNNPCTYFFGEAEDYTVNITTCNVPTGLTASSVTADAATLSWANAGGAKKYKLQYRIGNNSWTTVNNIADTFYNLTGLAAHTNYSYKVQSSCSAEMKSAFSTQGSFTTQNYYCTLAGITDYEWIEKVKLGSINNTSGNNNGYADYTALTTNISTGTSQTITLTPGFTNNPDGEYWEVYIDYNQNGDFTDAGEKAGFAKGTANKNISFTAPPTALNGSTRMRVAMNFDFYRNNPCASPGDYFGETEDYTVEITGGTLKTVAANTITSKTVKENILNTLIVSPNPVNTASVNIILQTASDGAVTIRVADLSGKILRSEVISSVIAGRNTHALRSLNLLPGTYMMVALQSDAIIARTKFVVAK